MVKNQIVVYESPTFRDLGSIKKFIKKDIPVWIVEPFHAYHHYKGARFFPPPIPDSIMGLVDDGEITLLKAEHINAKEISLLAADRAVSVIESVFTEYKRENEGLIKFVCDTLESPAAEHAFKFSLCDRLAEFYSVNIMLNRIDSFLDGVSMVFISQYNVHSYLSLKSLLGQGGQDHFDHPHIKFAARKMLVSYLENLKGNMVLLLMLFAQTIASGLLGRLYNFRPKGKKSYKYGISIIAPKRQLRGGQRGPDFLIDNNKIKSDDVVYFPLVNLTGKQKITLDKIPGAVCNLPKTGRYFSNFREWRKLLWSAVTQGLLRNREEVRTAGSLFFSFFMWSDVMKSISISHFITHGDFSVNHVGRNIALNHAGVQTWYFSDSMNFSANFKEDKEGYAMRHPFWSYLNYDHLVTWSKFLAEYFSSHPGSFNETHVVGCLWSGLIHAVDKKRAFIRELGAKDPEDAFIIAAFDSTYSMNSITSYAEGLAFANHLIKLADEFSDIHIFLKEKKSRSTHSKFDPEAGQKLIKLYDRMGSRDNITICSNQVDASRLISNSDLTISFPFTSTTFETLNVGKPAFWHDPLGYYRHTPYAETGGVTTHGYEELKQKVLEIKEAGSNSYISPLPAASPLMDPYRDGKAIDRFRQLLTSE